MLTKNNTRIKRGAYPQKVLSFHGNRPMTAIEQPNQRNLPSLSLNPSILIDCPPMISFLPTPMGFGSNNFNKAYQANLPPIRDIRLSIYFVIPLPMGCPSISFLPPNPKGFPPMSCPPNGFFPPISMGNPPMYNNPPNPKGCLPPMGCPPNGFITPISMENPPPRSPPMDYYYPPNPKGFPPMSFVPNGFFPPISMGNPPPGSPQMDYHPTNLTGCPPFSMGNPPMYYYPPNPKGCLPPIGCPPNGFIPPISIGNPPPSSPQMDYHPPNLTGCPPMSMGDPPVDYYPLNPMGFPPMNCPPNGFIPPLSMSSSPPRSPQMDYNPPNPKGFPPMSSPPDGFFPPISMGNPPIDYYPPNLMGCLPPIGCPPNGFLPSNSMCTPQTGSSHMDYHPPNPTGCPPMSMGSPPKDFYSSNPTGCLPMSMGNPPVDYYPPNPMGFPPMSCPPKGFFPLISMSCPPMDCYPPISSGFPLMGCPPNGFFPPHSMGYFPIFLNPQMVNPCFKRKATVWNTSAAEFISSRRSASRSSKVCDQITQTDKEKEMIRCCLKAIVCENCADPVLCDQSTQTEDQSEMLNGKGAPTTILEASNEKPTQSTHKSPPAANVQKSNIDTPYRESPQTNSVKSTDRLMEGRNRKSLSLSPSRKIVSVAFADKKSAEKAHKDSNTSVPKKFDNKDDDEKQKSPTTAPSFNSGNREIHPSTDSSLSQETIPSSNKCSSAATEKTVVSEPKSEVDIPNQERALHSTKGETKVITTEKFDSERQLTLDESAQSEVLEQLQATEKSKTEQLCSESQIEQTNDNALVVVPEKKDTQKSAKLTKAQLKQQAKNKKLTKSVSKQQRKQSNAVSDVPATSVDPNRLTKTQKKRAAKERRAQRVALEQQLKLDALVNASADDGRHKSETESPEGHTIEKEKPGKTASEPLINQDDDIARIDVPTGKVDQRKDNTAPVGQVTEGEPIRVSNLEVEAKEIDKNAHVDGADEKVVHERNTKVLKGEATGEEPIEKAVLVPQFNQTDDIARIDVVDEKVSLKRLKKLQKKQAAKEKKAQNASSEKRLKHPDANAHGPEVDVSIDDLDTKREAKTDEQTSSLVDTSAESPESEPKVEHTDNTVSTSETDSNDSITTEEDRLRLKLKKYQQRERIRRCLFFNYNRTLPKGTVLPWILKEVYLFYAEFGKDVRVEESIHKRLHQYRQNWKRLESVTEEEREQWLLIYKILIEEMDYTTVQDYSVVSELALVFPDHAAYLERAMRNVIFDDLPSFDRQIDIVVPNPHALPKLEEYLQKHYIRRYTKDKHVSQLEPFEVKAIVAFRKLPYCGPSILSARSLFIENHLHYKRHHRYEESSLIRQMADAYKHLAQIPSPILAYDTVMCRRMYGPNKAENEAMDVAYIKMIYDITD